jgi:hypothetical protein
MQVTLTVSDALVREAGARGVPVVDYIEFLIDKGRATVQERRAMSEAIERIRVLRGKGKGSQ